MSFRNRPETGGFKAQRPLMDPVVTAWHRGTPLAFAIEYRVVLGGLPLAHCAFHKWDQVHPEHMTDVKGSGEDVENITLQHCLA